MSVYLTQMYFQSGPDSIVINFTKYNMKIQIYKGLNILFITYSQFNNLRYVEYPTTTE